MELASEEGLAVLANGIDLVTMAVDLLLHLVAARTVSAEAKECRTAAAHSTRSLPHRKVRGSADAHSACALPKEDTPPEGMVSKAPLRSPTVLRAKEHEMRLCELCEPSRCGRDREKML